MTAPGLEKRAFNLKETAQRIGVSENIARRELREGRLRYRRAGRRICVSDQAIQEWLDGSGEERTECSR